MTKQVATTIFNIDGSLNSQLGVSVLIFVPKLWFLMVSAGVTLDELFGPQEVWKLAWFASRSTGS